MAMRYGSAIFHIGFFIVVSVFILDPAHAEEEAPSLPSGKLTLVAAVVCEGIDGNEPQGQGIVFSASRGNVFCFTHFEPVPAKTYIYHNWFFKETLKAKRRLSVNPPKWSTFSKLQIQEKDKGPWRVEIRDEKGKLLKLLRFSVVE